MISLILLASGFSRRFGSNKLLHKINGKPMYLHILEKLHRLSLHAIENHEVQIVVVSRYLEIQSTAKQMGINYVQNDKAEEGIAASVRLGTLASDGADWYVFFTADQPYLKEESILLFLEHVVKEEASLASVHTKGEPGNPTAFHRYWREELLALKGDRGGRILLKKNPDKVYWYEIDEMEKKDFDFSENL